MPRTRSLAWSQLKIGIAVAVAAAIVVLMVFAVGGEGGYSWQRYPLKARFDNVLGLKPGAVVRVGGKEIGTVVGVDFAGTEIEVVFEVLKSVRPIITSESVATIGSLSLLGEPIIDVTAGRGGESLADYAYVSTATVSSFQDLSASADTTLGQIDQMVADMRAGKGTLGRIVADDALYTEMTALVSSAKAVTESLESGRGTIGGLLKDREAYTSLKASLENLQTMTARINAGEGALGRLLRDEATGRSISNVTSQLDQVTGRLARGEGTAGRLLTDRELYDRLNAMAGKFDQLASGLEAGRGTAGLLLRDQQLYENMNRAVAELRDLVADIRKDPRKYLRVNVSIF